jgi:molecular chaperone GrpE
VTSDGRPGFGTGGRFGPPASEEPEPVVVRDRRRVSPEGGPPAGSESFGAESFGAESFGAEPEQFDVLTDDEAGAAPAVNPEVSALTIQLEERTADLQRLKAEYDNYRRRAERDRQAVAEQATAKVLGSLLATLDDIARASAHGDLTGPFQAVAASLEGAVTALGLESYGEMGDPFDPQVHEALVHSYQPGLEGPTCVEIYRSGYRYAGRVLRPAQVVVAEPPAPEASADGSP